MLINAGHYAFAYFGPKMDGAGGMAKYTTSDLLDLSAPHCISFFYRNHRISGKPGANLILFLVNAANLETKQWEENRDHGKRWMAVKKTLTQQGLFRLRVRTPSTAQTFFFNFFCAVVIIDLARLYEPIFWNGFFMLQFSASAAKNARSGVALDDVAVTPGSCDHPADCKFNSADKMCTWQHADGLAGNFRWQNRAAPSAPVTKESEFQPKLCSIL